MTKKIVSSVIFIMLSLLAQADVHTSKANGYAIVGPPDGVSASKANGYAIVGPPDGVSASKANGYAIVGPPDGVSASKVVAYAIVETKQAQQPNVFIITKNNYPLNQSSP